jgi:Tol biopolymer transport system component
VIDAWTRIRRVMKRARKDRERPPLWPASIVALALALALAVAMAGTAAAAGPSRVLFKAEGWLQSVRPGSRAFHRVARAPARTSDVAATDDGRWVVAITNRSVANHQRERQIYLFGPHGGRRAVLRRPLVTVGADEVAISPDGRLIAFGDQNELWVVNRDGTGMRQVTEGAGTAFAPAFTPDGESLVFDRYTDRVYPRIFVVPLAGGAEQSLTPARQISLDPTVSGAGRIAYIFEGESGSFQQLRTMSLDGTADRLVFMGRSTSTVYAPDFSPNGGSLVFASGTGRVFTKRRYSLVRVAASGSGRRTIVRGLREHHPSPQWTRVP